MKSYSNKISFLFILVIFIVAILTQLTMATTVTLWNLNANVAARTWYNEVFKPAFEEAFPHATLEMAFHSTSTFYDRLLVAIASGVAPDVITSNNPLFYVEGLVMDLNDLIDSWPLAQEMYPPILNMLKYQGHIYVYHWLLRLVHLW